MQRFEQPQSSACIYPLFVGRSGITRSTGTPKTDPRHASLPGDHRALEPPDPIPNSAVKRCIADGSVGFPHVRVGHRQASKRKTPCSVCCRGFCFLDALILCPVRSSPKGCHVSDPAPKVRGAGAAGVAKQSQAALATSSRSHPYTGADHRQALNRKRPSRHRLGRFTLGFKQRRSGDDLRSYP